MKTLIQGVRERLQETLDAHFPKIEEEGEAKRLNKRSEALMLYSTAVIELEGIIKAFGSCEKCYGKGYGTQTLGTRSMTDFGDEKEEYAKLPSVVFCTCSRGEQLEALMN